MLTFIDLVITDYQMAGMDGLEFLCRLGRMHPTIPAIMPTGQGMLENYQKAIGLGTTAYLPKPLRARKLMRVVAVALGESADARVPFASSSHDAGLHADGVGDHSQRITGSLAISPTNIPATMMSIAGRRSTWS